MECKDTIDVFKRGQKSAVTTLVNEAITDRMRSYDRIVNAF